MNAECLAVAKLIARRERAGDEPIEVVLDAALLLTMEAVMTGRERASPIPEPEEKVLEVLRQRLSEPAAYRRRVEHSGRAADLVVGGGAGLA